jgi:hypothetical protein
MEPNELVEPIVVAFETLAKATVESDKSLLELIQAVTARVIELEDKVNLLLMVTQGKQ